MKNNKLIPFGKKKLPFITQQLRTDLILDIAAPFSLASYSVPTLVLSVYAQFFKKQTQANFSPLKLAMLDMKS